MTELVRLLEAGGPLKRYSWHYARWHRFIWGSAQAAVRTVTERQRLFGADGLPHVLLTEALAFLVSGQYLQHVAFGTRRVKKSDGSYVEFSKTERTQCCEHLWKLYVQSRSDMEPEQTDEEEQQLEDTHGQQLDDVTVSLSQTSVNENDDGDDDMEEDEPELSVADIQTAQAHLQPQLDTFIAADGCSYHLHAKAAAAARASAT